MKKVITIIFAALTTMTVFGQSFEGKIIYSNSYKSKNPKMTDQQWTSMMGSTQEYLIERWRLQINYKWDFNSMATLYQ